MDDLADITAVILAGGLGTRLRSVVADRPKALVEIQGRPFLAHLLDQLVASGFRYVVLCTGYLGEQVRAVFGGSYGTLRLTYSQESKQLGTAGALLLPLPLVRSETLLIMNGDSFCDVDLREFWAWHCARRAKGSIMLTCVPDTSRFGQVQVEPDGRVRSFMEKGEARGAGWISAGTYLLSKDWLHDIPAGRPVSIEKEMFPAWAGQGLYGYMTGGEFIDIGTPESYALAQKYLLPKEWCEPASLCIVET